MVADVVRHPEADIAALNDWTHECHKWLPRGCILGSSLKLVTRRGSLCLRVPRRRTARQSTPAHRRSASSLATINDSSIYESHNGFRYLAGELSFPAPGGLKRWPRIQADSAADADWHGYLKS